VARVTEIGGQHICEGQNVVLWDTSANRAECVFAEPCRFDVGRTPNEHVGFGEPGPHFRLGANLARQETPGMFRELFRRLPDLRIGGEPARSLSGFINGINHMPCEFTPGGR
jgi:cytochrome P450